MPRVDRWEPQISQISQIILEDSLICATVCKIFVFLRSFFKKHLNMDIIKIFLNLCNLRNLRFLKLYY